MIGSPTDKNQELEMNDFRPDIHEDNLEAPQSYHLINLIHQVGGHFSSGWDSFTRKINLISDQVHNKVQEVKDKVTNSISKVEDFNESSYRPIASTLVFNHSEKVLLFFDTTFVFEIAKERDLAFERVDKVFQEQSNNTTNFYSFSQWGLSTPFKPADSDSLNLHMQNVKYQGPATFEFVFELLDKVYDALESEKPYPSKIYLFFDRDIFNFSLMGLNIKEKLKEKDSQLKDIKSFEMIIYCTVIPKHFVEWQKEIECITFQKI